MCQTLGKHGPCCAGYRCFTASGMKGGKRWLHRNFYDKNLEDQLSKHFVCRHESFWGLTGKLTIDTRGLLEICYLQFLLLLLKEGREGGMGEGRERKTIDPTNEYHLVGLRGRSLEKW